MASSGRAGRVDGQGRRVLTARWLRSRYLDQDRSADQIAAETGWSGQYVRDRLRDHGIPLRPAGSPKTINVEPAKLREWLDQGASIPEVAERVGFSPSGVRNLLRRAGLPSTTGPRRTAPDTSLLEEVLRLYRDEGRSLEQVGAGFGHGPDWVKARLAAAGCPLRPAGTPRSTFTPTELEQLRRWRVEEGLTIAEVAARAARPAATVAEQLRKAGVLTAPRRRQAPALDAELVRRLYVDQRRTLMQIARQLCCSDTRMRAALLDAGVELRPPRRRRDRPAWPPLSEAELRELYLERGLTAAQIAARFGGSSTWVLAALDRHGIPRRPGGSRPVPTLDVDAATLTDLYVHRRLDDAAIAARLNVPTSRVLARRRQLGVSRPFAPPHPGPPPAPPVEVLQRLYLEEQLPIAVIAKRYRTATPVARRWLHQAGIPIRPRTDRTHRRQWDLALLRELYEDREWSSAQVAGIWTQPIIKCCGLCTTPAFPSAAAAVARGDGRQRRSSCWTRCTPAPKSAPSCGGSACPGDPARAASRTASRCRSG